MTESAGNVISLLIFFIYKHFITFEIGEMKITQHLRVSISTFEFKIIFLLLLIKNTLNIIIIILKICDLI